MLHSINKDDNEDIWQDLIVESYTSHVVRGKGEVAYQAMTAYLAGREVASH